MEQSNTNTNLFDLQIDDQSNSYLTETAKWAKFLSILGFIGCGLLVILAIGMGTFMGSMMQNSMMPGGGFLLSILYIAMAALYFIPCLYLYRFAGSMQLALRAADAHQLQTSFRNLKSCFKFLGILTIVILSIYALAMIGGLTALAFSV